jgi:hypothetical protein
VGILTGGTVTISSPGETLACTSVVLARLLAMSIWTPSAKVEGTMAGVHIALPQRFTTRGFEA